MTDLLDYARHEFRLNKVGKDGKSLRATCKAVEAQTGRMPEEGINPVPFPGELAHIWLWYADLEGSRDVGLAVGPITFTSMRSYFDLTKERPQAWEIDVIKQLDRLSMEFREKPNGGHRNDRR